ncbi:MAG: DUF2357 domain-containing protein [Planctomycetota bacterium]
MTTDLKVRLARLPWLESTPELVFDRDDRPILWASSDVVDARLERPRSALASRGQVEWKTERWSLWELPLPEVEEGSRLHLTLRDDQGVREDVVVECLGARWRPEAENDEEKAQTPEAFSLHLLGRYIEKVSEVFEGANRGARSLGGRRVLWSDLANRVLGAGDDSAEAPLSLIVRIAEHLDRTLGPLCESPRRFLRRTRQLERLDRSMQLDATCIRWLASRPGRRMVDRTDAQERLLSVVRVETYDTLENRVLRDLLRRSRDAAQRYESTYRSRRGSTRLRRVENFGRLVQRLLTGTVVRDVAALERAPEPNYTLLFDERYQPVWTWYLALLRQDRQEERAWVWRHRMWAEACGLVLQRALLHSALDSNTQLRGFADLAQEQDRGRFIDPGSRPGPSLLPGVTLPHMIAWYGGTADQGEPESIHRLRALAPDWILAWQPAFEAGGPSSLVGVWCQLDFVNGGGDDEHEQLSSLCRAVSLLGLDVPVHVHLLVPAVGDTSHVGHRHTERSVTAELIGVRLDSDESFEPISRLFAERLYR